MCNTTVAAASMPHKSPLTCGWIWVNKPENVGFDLSMLVYLHGYFALWSPECSCCWVLLSCPFSSPHAAQTQLWTAMQVALCIKKHSHRPQVPPRHPQPPLIRLIIREPDKHSCTHGRCCFFESVIMEVQSWRHLMSTRPAGFIQSFKSLWFPSHHHV